MPNKYWLKTLFFLCALALFGKIDAQVRFKVALSSDSTRYQVSLYSETGPFSQSSANIISSATVTLIAPTGQVVPTAVNSQTGLWSGQSTFINPVGELGRDYFVFTLNNPNSDIVFTPGLEVNLFSFANTMTCAGAVELMDNDNDPLREQDPNVNVGNQITVVNFGQTNAYGGAFQPGSANCMGAPACDLTINSVSKTAITSCGGDNGIIIINASNNSGTLLYSIDNGINWLNTNIFLNLGIGNYTIKVKDDICEQIHDSNPVAILEPGITVQVTDSIPASCNTSQDGKITVVASGGLAPYEYSINNGVNWTTNGTFASLGNGIFTVKARNADSTCETTYPNLIVFSTQGINIGVDKTDVSCTTGTNGTIDISAAGGIGTFNYSIDSGQTWLATSSFTNLVSGDYYVFVRNSNGNCETAYPNNPISISESALNYTVIAANPPCTGGLLGSIDIAVNGETGSFEYSIDNGATWLATATFSNLDTGNYNIIVRATGGGCESPYANNPVVLSISPINISITTLAGGCENDQSNRIIVSASGGTSVFEYSKDNGVTWQASNIFENLANGDYILKVRNTDETCETAYAANPVSFTGNAINIGLNTIAPSCDIALDGSINISASGGNGSYIYSIDDGITYDNISVFTGLGNGMYTIKVKNADGTCETTYANNPIQFNTPALTLVASATDAACSIATDGSIAMLGNGGTGNFEYSIDSGLTWSTTTNHQNLLADAYYLQIRNANGTCETAYPSNPIDLRPDSLVVSIVSNTPPSCVNDNDGSLVLTATGGGNNNYEFSIDDGMTWESIGTFQNLPSGAYAIKAKISNTDCITTYSNNPVLVENTNCPDLSTVDTCLLAYGLSESNGIYTISLKTDTTWLGNQASVSNAQVAIRVPTGGFQIGNISNKLTGANFAVTGESINPNSAAGYDYYAFTLHAITTAIPFTKGNTVDLFSFENVGNCIGGAMNLIGRGAIAEPGIDNLNFDAQITVAGWGAPDAPVCSANNEVPICDPAPECIVNLVLDKSDNLFTVGMIPDTTWAAPLNTMNSAQVTLRIPSKGYTVENFKNAIDGVAFDLTSRQNSPIIEAGYDYLSITLGSFGTTGIPFNKGIKTNLFSFEINGACAADSIYLVGEGSAFAFPNGENDNITSQMTVLGWNMADIPVCVQAAASPLCPMEIDLVLKSNASYCGASDGTIAIGSFCTGNQTQYSIDNGSTYQVASEFNNLSAGNYFVKIRNQATNCELNYMNNPIMIADGASISFMASPVNPTCVDSTNGSIILTANNGGGSYLYSLDDGVNWSTNPTFSGLGNGSYTPKVSNLDTTCITAYDTLSLTLIGISCTRDSDGDGQADITEDLNMDGNLENDDTDMDGIPNYQDADDDGDGISTAMEEAGPNQGDSNGDGNPDCLQENVATTQDEQGDFRTLEVNNATCQKISEFVIYPEGRMSENDPNYDFPFQLNAFTIPCGGTVTINLYFHNVADLADFEYRKFGPTIPGGAISAWYDFPVTIAKDTIGGIIIGKVTFQLTDGGIGDATGVDNIIVDPGGIAMNVNNNANCSINYDLEKIGEAYMVSLTSDTSLTLGENEVDSAMITLRAPTGILDVINFTNDDINVLFELDTVYVAPIETPNYDYFVFELSTASLGTNNISIFQDLKEPLFAFENGGACSFDSLFLVGTNATFTTPMIGGRDIASAITLSGWNAPTCVTNTGGLFCEPVPRDTVEVAMFAGLAATICLTNDVQLPNNIGTTAVLFQGAAVTGATSVMDSCVELNAQANFAGRDFITVVFCDAVNTTICDTTVLDITVSLQPACLINFFIEDSMGTFQCKMVSDTTWNEPLNEVISAQFTIRTPTGSFEMANLQNGLGMVDFDLQTTTTQGGYDYLNIVLQTLNTQDIPFQKGDTVCLFSFENSRYCTVDSLFLVGEGSPITAPEVGDEPIFSKLAIQGWGGGTQSVPACVMNYGLPICRIITPTTDTIHLVIEENDTLSVCIDSVLELLNTVGVVNVCINGMALDIAVNNNDSCVTVQAPPNFIGNDTICVMHFDIAELGYRDTTIFVITVNEKPFAPTDTVNFTISDTMDVCLDAALQLNNIGTATILSTGNQVNVIVNDNNDCITLQPIDGFVGNDTLQVIHCDANDPTFCDTTIIVVTIEAPVVCLFEYLIEATDDVYKVKLVVGADVISNLSATQSMLVAIRVPANGYNVPTDSITTLLAGAAFENTSNGVLLDEEEPNYGYILFDIGGIVTPTYQQGDTLDLFSFRGNNCVEDGIKLVGPGASFPNPIVNTEEITSFLSIGAYLPTGGTPYCVNPVGGIANCNPEAAPKDTLHYVLDFETPQIVCIDSALQLLNTVGNVTVCEQGTNVTINVINGDSCVALTPATNFSGNDTLCVVHCDAVMTDFCDTTILIITVNPNEVTPPTAVDSTCRISFDLALTNGVYVVSMTSDTTLTNTTFPTPIFPNPFIPAPTNLMDITVKAPTGQLQIVNQIDFGTGREFVLKSSIISPAEDPTHDYFVFGLNANNTPTINIPYVAGASLDLFSFQNINCSLDSISLVGRGTDFGELIINGTNINTNIIANSDTIATCVNSTNITPPMLALSTTSTAPTTGICNDGTITITATGGTGLYDYSINNGTDWFLNNEFTSLEVGTYLVRVRSTDEVCLSDAETVLLQNMDCASACDIVITSIDSTNATCSAANGIITVNATGSNLQYSINTGATFQGNNIFESVAAGTYNIIVRDSVTTSCEANITITLNGTTLPEIQSVELTETNTFVSNLGTITIFATGAGDLRYSIDGGLNFFEGNTFNNLGIGSYTVVVANGDESCPVMYGNNPIQIDQPCMVDAGADRTICLGAAVTLSTSGTAPIFGWTPSTGLSCTDCSNPIANPDTTTTYIVTNSGGGCFVMDTIIITVLPSINAGFNFMTSCADLSVQFTDTSRTTGTITSYAWDFGDGGVATVANPNYTYTTAGSYTVQLTTTIAGDCTNTVSKLVMVGNGLVGTVSDDTNICAGDCTQLMATGGTVYTWMPANGLSATNIANPMACPTETTTYYVTISNGVGCSTMDSVTVTVTSPTIGVSAAGSTCGDNNGVITIFASLSGEMLEFQLFDNDEWFTSNSFTNLVAGEYNVRVRTTAGTCVTAFPNNPIVIGDTPGAVIDSITANSPTDCNMANGNMTIAASGANPLIYSIDDGANWSASNSFTGLGQGNYSVQVAYSDTTCITATQTISLDPPMSPIILNVNSINPTTCGNNDGLILIEVEGLGDINNIFEYSLDGINWQLSNIIDTLSAGTYAVFVRYENQNCITEYPTTITLNPASPPVISAVEGTAPSSVDNNDGIIEITATGSAPIEYSIDNGTTWQASNTFNGLDTGTYAIIVRYTDESCPTVYDRPFILSVDICLTITNITSMNPEGCGINTGVIVISATGTNDLEYSVDSGRTWQMNNNFSDLDIGIYHLFVRHIDSTCLTPLDSTVVLNASGQINILEVIATNPTGCPDNNGSIEIIADGGINLEYSIDNGATWQADSIFNDLTTSAYTIVVRTADEACQTTYNEPVFLIGDFALDITAVTSTNPAECGATNGMITITAAGSDTLEYSIDNGGTWQSDNSFNNLPAGIYTIVVRTPDNLCQAIYNAPVILMGSDDIMITDVSSTNPTDCGGTNGIITITAAGASNIEYSIDNGGSWQVSNVFTNLPAGAYTIMVRTGDLLCQAIYPTPVVLMGSGDLSIIEVTATNSGDCGANNGTITINATGTNILQYSINNGATWEFSNTFTNLAPGIYTVLIQTPDALCQVAYNAPVEITGSQAITILDVFSSHPTEVGVNDGVIEVFATGNNPLEYSIDNGVNWQPSNLFNGLNEGAYTVLVRYTNGTCEVAYQVQIILSTERCLLFIEVLAHSPQGCGTNDGHIFIFSDVVGDNVEYSINNGIDWQNMEAFENLSPGEYTILARRTDINCQIALDSTITLEEGEDLIILQVDAIDRDVCNNFGGEIFISTNIFNDIEYSIDNGLTWQFDPFFSNVDIGIYTILARSVDLTCQTPYNVPVQINAVQNADISNVLANNPTNCNSANGSLFIEANVGFNSEFSIDNGITWQPNNDFNNLAAGTYYIKVRTGSCEIDYAENPVILGSPNAFSIITPIPNRAICTDALMSISVTLSDLIVSYQVNKGTIANPVLNGTTLTFDAVVTELFNEYEITFTNAIGCQVTESFTIFQATDTEADFVVIEPYCREMEVRLLFTGTATPMANLIWELDGGVLISSSPATATEPAGKEIVVRWDNEGSRLIKLTVNDGGCIDDEYESIFVRKLPLVDAGENASICMGECVELEGSGTGVWYTWSPAAGLSSTNGQNVTACPTETTTYTLTVMSADGCVSVDSVTVNVETGFVIMTEDVTICEGESTALGASGGTTYTWFPAVTLDNPNTATPIATPAVTTLYKVASANENGCIDTAYVTVFVNPKPEAIACEDKTICRGDSIQLIVTTHAQYSWSPTNTLINPNSGTPIAFPMETTTYTVTVTDENGCTDTDEVIVFVNTPPTVNAGNDVTICTNATTSLSASGAVNYSWSPAQGLSNPNIANPLANPSTTTTYTVIGTDFNGCTNIDQVTVAVIESTGISAGNDVTICEGNIVQLNAVGGSNYVWSPSTGLNNPNIANPIAIPTVTTTYTVTGISQNGCPSVDEVVIFVNPRPDAIACEDKTICSGESIQLIVTTHAQYSWSPTNTLLNPTSGTSTAFPTETTTYTVTVTDENGCTDTDEVVVFVNSPNIVNLGPDVTLCGAGTVALDAGEGIAYQWSPTTGLSNPNSRNPIATVTNTTTYTVQVTNADGCIGTDNVTININNGPNADAGPPVVLCPGGSGQLMASGGVSYQWSPATGLSNPNIANPIVTATQVTNYRVTVTDEFGCTATDETLVTVSLPLAVDPIINNANCCGTGGSAILNVSGGFGNATFNWSPNVSTSNTATNLAAGFYKVVISDAVGCSIIFTFEIKEDCDGCPDMFSEEEVCISDTATIERICVPIALEDVGGYEILVGGATYLPDHGCAHENLTAYSYALVEGQGNTGMYQVENWEVNGQMFNTEVETMQELTFWMNTVDPTGNWIIHPSILTIIGGDPNKTYGTMKVIQLTKWIETMLQPDVTGVATSSIIEVDVRTMNQPIEVIITDTATCCSDTLLIKRCGEEQPCVVEIIAPNQFQEMIDCGESAKICLDIPFSNINNYDLVANNSPFAGEILPCNYDSMFAYTYFTLPGQGLAGPYEVTNWIVDGQMHAGMFNTLSEFAQLMNQIDPTGNWKLEENTLTIQGGNSMTDYGAINIEQTTTGSIANLEINANLIPMGTQLTFASGNYEVLINDINSGCRDRFLVNVSCDGIDPVDTTITPVDTTITPVDTTITPVDTTITPVDTTITPVDTTITPVDTTITPVDTTITPVDTTITPVDTTITPVDTTITPVDTTITPVDTTITPVDTTITPVDTTITPVDTTITPELCIDFITEEVLFAMINRCDSLATFCMDIPFEEINDYAITVDGQVYQGDLMNCTGGTAIQVGVGGFSFLFEHLTTGCKDSIVLAVTCATSPREEVITLEEGETEIYCPASDELIGDIITINNACPEESGILTMLTLDTVDYCINVTGLLAGEEKACLVLCDANGICDTTYLIIRVTPKPLLKPIAERDIDTTEESTIITIDVLANDSVFGTLQNMEILAQPENGTATFNLDNTITYIPNDGFCDSGQPDLIMYGICNDNGCDTAMVEIWVPCGNLDIKNGFSPNNDGVNDYFRISGVQNFPDNKVTIFNRWGLEVFSQQGYKNRWNGTFKDKDLPDGTYFYIFDDGKGKKYSGWVQINR